MRHRHAADRAGSRVGRMRKACRLQACWHRGGSRPGRLACPAASAAVECWRSLARPCGLPARAGQGLKHSHWDKVLPHLDYALFCIKSPIPGGLRPRWLAARAGWGRAQRSAACPQADSLPGATAVRCVPGRLPCCLLRSAVCLTTWAMPFLAPAPAPRRCRRQVRVDHQAADRACPGLCG